MDFNITPAHMIIIVRKCNRLRHMILALTEARGLSTATSWLLHSLGQAQANLPAF